METLTYRRFLSTADAGWAAAYRLYEASFPPCERRSERDYDAALADGRLHAESVWDGDLFVGLVFWWLADEGCAYLEHLAVEPVLRGHNYGARILHDLCRRAGRVILEIDPPEDEISRRRRGFYERNGFVYNEYDYIHPSYLRPPQPHRLMVMSYPEAISPPSSRRSARSRAVSRSNTRDAEFRRSAAERKAPAGSLSGRGLSCPVCRPVPASLAALGTVPGRSKEAAIVLRARIRRCRRFCSDWD